ncbi:MAG: UvrB/UvrC motif-containing protein [Planctomycetota bacterium]
MTALRDNLRQRFDLQNTIRERLAQAIASEDYEQAAQLRDQLHGQVGD